MVLPITASMYGSERGQYLNHVIPIQSVDQSLIKELRMITLPECQVGNELDETVMGKSTHYNYLCWLDLTPFFGGRCLPP